KRRPTVVVARLPRPSTTPAAHALTVFEGFSSGSRSVERGLPRVAVASSVSFIFLLPGAQVCFPVHKRPNPAQGFFIIHEAPAYFVNRIITLRKPALQLPNLIIFIQQLHRTIIGNVDSGCQFCL